jgi:hypothetical protein
VTSQSLARRVTDKAGSLILGLTPGIAFWVIVTYLTYTSTAKTSEQAWQQGWALLFGWLTPSSSAGLLVKLVVGGIDLVIGLWFGISILITSPIGLLLLFAPKSRVAAAILLALVLATVYWILGREGVVAVLRKTIRAIETLVGVTGRSHDPARTEGVRMNSQSAEQAANQAEATLRQSLNDLHDSMKGIGGIRPEFCGKRKAA